MKKFIASVVVAGLAVAPSLAATVDVYLVPSNPVITVGQTVTIQIVADISDPVLGWGLDLDSLSPAIADKTGNQSIGSAWQPVNSIDGDNLAGVVPIPLIGISGTGILLASVDFIGLSVGIAPLDLKDDYPNDLSEGFALDPTGFAMVTYNDGSITVVPEPAAIALIALGGLASLRRR